MVQSRKGTSQECVGRNKSRTNKISIGKVSIMFRNSLNVLNQVLVIMVQVSSFIHSVSRETSFSTIVPAHCHNSNYYFLLTSSKLFLQLKEIFEYSGAS